MLGPEETWGVDKVIFYAGSIEYRVTLWFDTDDSREVLIQCMFDTFNNFKHHLGRKN